MAQDDQQKNDLVEEIKEDSKGADVLSEESKGKEGAELVADENVHEEKKKSFFHRECKKCDEHKKEMEEYKAGWQRALADYKNLQKEISERRGEWMQMSEQQILEEFIPVYDHLKMSVAGAGEGGPWLEGVKHVLRQFAEILKSHGVEEIKTVGEKFDPTKHEAVGEDEGEGESGIIIKEVSSGYIMGNRTIKAAKVIVNK